MEKHLKDIWFDEKNIKLRKRIYDYKLDLKICRLQNVNESYKRSFK